MYLFFGDSLAAGENCDRYDSFCYKLGKPVMSVKNYAIRGTTIGEYSIYPVDGYSLVSRVSDFTKSIAVDADTIFIEYGSNDVSAVMCGFATIQTVIVSLVKALDCIRQINSHAKIYFLVYGSDKIIVNRAERMCDYLKNEYFKDFDFEFPTSKYVDTYKQIVDNVRKVCDTITMFDDEMLDNMDDYISDDNIHPNKKGHERIAQNILKQLDNNRA